MNMGLRNGGGLGDYLEKQDHTESSFLLRTIFDLNFFIIVNIFLLNIVFGIIIDTFAALVRIPPSNNIS